MIENRLFTLSCQASALACTSIFIAVYYLQYITGLTPCPLCILQRLPLLAILLLSLPGALPFAAVSRLFSAPLRRFQAFLCSLMAGIGLALAGRHLWLQQLPAEEVPACGPTLDVLIEILPPFEVLQMVLAGDGSCAEVQWAFLGLSLPGWAGLAFATLGLLWLWQLFSRQR